MELSPEHKQVSEESKRIVMEYVLGSKVAEVTVFLGDTLDLETEGKN